MAMVLVKPRRAKRKYGAPRRLFGVQRRRIVIPRPLRGAVRVGGYYGRFRGRAAPAGGELKFFDTTQLNVAVDTTAVILQSLNEIPQGVTESERVGRKCAIRQIAIQGTFSNTPVPDPGDTDQNLRIILYLDQQANGQAAPASAILESFTGLNGGFNSFYNLAESGRIKILYDRRHNMSLTGVASSPTGSFQTSWKWSVTKSCNIPIEFNASTGAITEIRSNNIGLLFVTRMDVGPALISYTSRVRFSDS